MKNRKFIIIAFVLVSAMVVGVGYATLTDTLTINGDLEFSAAEINEAFDDDVFFKSVSIKSADASGVEVNPNDTTKLSASVNANDPDKITFNAKNMWAQVDQTVTIVATIENTGTNADKDAILSVSVSAATGDQYFQAVSKVFTMADSSTVDVTNGGTATLPVGQTCTLTIVFKCIELPTSAATASVIYDLVATAAE